jgi:aerobic-type carbon monoxide dehydrogenase small subunit (CoxS/CutS family)
MSARHLKITLSVNGETVSARIEARKTLVDFLRDDLSLTGSHVGCEHGICGACTVLLNGESIRGCLTFAVQCDGAEVETIEGLSDSGAVADLQRAFQERNALQCGYCTPGILNCWPLARCRAERRSASISPAIIAAVPAIRRSSTRSRPWRGRGRR